jgi:hypothetical protein
MGEIGSIITIAGNLGGAVIIGLSVVWVLHKSLETFERVQGATLTAFQTELNAEREGSERRHTETIRMIERTHEENTEALAETRGRVDAVQRTLESLIMGKAKDHA